MTSKLFRRPLWGAVVGLALAVGATGSLNNTNQLAAAGRSETRPTVF